jgi:hypothetical protein
MKGSELQDQEIYAYNESPPGRPLIHDTSLSQFSISRVSAWEEGLTHVTGIRKLVVAAIKIKEPNQSNVFSLSQMDPSLGCSLRQMGIPAAASTQKGMLSQKIQRQVVSWAKAPPITGPMTLPMAHCKLMIAIHLPRSLRLTRSAIKT